MARKRKRKRKPQSRPGAAHPPQDVAPTAAGSVDEANKIARLIARGEYKSAVNRAKAVHQRLGTAESEALLTNAYLARAEALATGGMTAESRALLELVSRRFPACRERVGELELLLKARGGAFAELVGPLADPETEPARRAAIESAVRREVTDLATLADTPALAPEDPLRVAAGALSQAFAAVTRGPVRDQELALGEVSRRSPLAPWKMLVRALAAFYRHDDAGAERCLEAIASDSAPARLVPALRAMLVGGRGDALKPRAAALVRQVSGEDEELRAQLRRLDAAFARGHQGKLLQAVRKTIGMAGESPELLCPLKQHISIRCHLAGIRERDIRAALAGPALHDAAFWRLAACALERHPAKFPNACGAWDRFRRHALHEGWFSAEGPEAAAVCLHMAELLTRFEPEELREAREDYRASFPGFGAFYQGQPARIQAVAPRDDEAEEEDYYYLDPKSLYERAIACQSDPETFRQYLAWTRRDSDWRAGDKVALAWYDAFPDDSRPLLDLMESAENRGALNKALQYLEKAENLDRLRPQVRTARLRLVVATTRRHLDQKKLHLADKDVAALGALPQARTGDLPALVDALRWTCHRLRENRSGARKFRDEIARRLESKTAALLLVRAVGRVCGLADARLPALRSRAPRLRRGELAVAVARASALGHAVGMPIEIPSGWKKRLIDDVWAPDVVGKMQHLRSLAEAALRLDEREVAYAAAGVGLAQGGAERARFLLLRARSLPVWATDRRDACLIAVIELARQQRDMELVSEAVEVRRTEVGFGFFPWLDPLTPGESPISSDELEALLRGECAAREFPEVPQEGWDEDEDDYDPFCQCPECRRRRGEVPVFDDDEDELFLHPELAGMPPKLLALMLEAMAKYGGEDGEIPEPEEIEARDPELHRRLEQAILEHFGSEGEGPGFRNPGRKRGGKRKRRGKR